MAALEHYQFLRTLGRGSFGKVKRKNSSVAEHTVTKKLVAIKIMSIQTVKRKKLVRKVNREIRILKFVDHVHVLRM